MAVTPENLILRAAHLLKSATGATAGAAITCVKRIPIGGGLAGGSADAAATLRALNDLWACGLDSAQLARLAEALGADVPFAIVGGTAFAVGSGADVTMLPDAPPCWIVLVPLESHSDEKTREMYRRFGPEDYTDGSRARAMAEAVANGRLPCEAVWSAFTRHAVARWPVIGVGLEEIRASGALAASVSGAGPSFFGLFPSRAAARQAVAGLAARGLDGRVVRPVPRSRVDQPASPYTLHIKGTREREAT
jgi:4-diphosphocytidyl-2-C-methyl-D-erythritol kinase